MYRVENTHKKVVVKTMRQLRHPEEREQGESKDHNQDHNLSPWVSF